MKKVLLVFTLTVICCFTANAQCGDLFISEVVEGRGNNKGVEIYNPTDNAINLSQYKLKRYSNGSATSVATFNFASVDLMPGDAYVLTNGQTTVEAGGTSPPSDAAIRAIADELDNGHPSITYANGNDAITLEKSVNGSDELVDVFGVIGEDPFEGQDPRVGWTNADGSVATVDVTLVRKPSISAGISTNPDSFDPSVEWIPYPVGVISTLGNHVADCQPAVCSMPVLDFSTWCEDQNTFSMRIFTLSSTIDDATFTVSDNRGTAPTALVLNPTEDQFYGNYPDGDDIGVIIMVTNDQNGDCISSSLTEKPFFRGSPNCDSLIVDPGTSIQSLTLTNTKVFPNPAQDDLFFVSDEMIDNVSLFSTTGKLLIDQNINGIQGQLDLTNIPSGIYLFKINYDEERSSFQKVIIE